MPVPMDTINRRAVLFQLREAIAHLETFCEEIEQGEHDESSEMPLSIDFAHILSHLCRAWHFKWMSDEDIDALTQEEWDLTYDSVPKWNLDARLVEMDELKQFDRRE